MPASERQSTRTDGDTERPRLRRRWPWLALASVLLTGSLPWLMCPRLDRSRAHQDTAHALASLRGCLFGTAAVASGAALRKRAITADLNPSPGADRWPARCAGAAAHLQLAVSRLARLQPSCGERRCCPGNSHCTAVEQLRQQVARAHHALRGGEAPGTLMSDLFTRAAAAGFESRADAVSEPPPPPPAVLATAADQSPLALGRFGHLELASTAAGARLLWHEQRQRLRCCQVALDQATAHCATVPANVPVSGAVALPRFASDSPMLLFAEETPSKAAAPGYGFYRCDDGALVWHLKTRPATSYVWADGTITAVLTGHGAEQLAVLRHPADNGPNHTSIVAAARANNPVIAGHHLAWLAPEDDGWHLWAAELELHGDATRTPSDIGPVGALPEPVALRVCEAAGTVAVVARGASRGFETQIAVALRDASGWHRPIGARIASRELALSCHRGGATASWLDLLEERALASGRGTGHAVRSWHRISELDCLPSGCKPRQVELSIERHDAASRHLIAALPDAAVLLWRGRLGDVRLRFSELDDLGHAPSAALFDDEPHGGFAWEAGTTVLRTQGSWALLLVGAERQTSLARYAFVLGHAGARPVRLAPSSP